MASSEDSLIVNTDTQFTSGYLLSSLNTIFSSSSLSSCLSSSLLSSISNLFYGQIDFFLCLPVIVLMVLGVIIGVRFGVILSHFDTDLP